LDELLKKLLELKADEEPLLAELEALLLELKNEELD
jgi:hypothetical protein